MQDMSLSKNKNRASSKCYEIDSYVIAEKFLDFVMPNSDAKTISRRLIDEFGSFYDACNAPCSKLCKIEGITEQTAKQLKNFPMLARAYKMSMYDKKHVFSDIDDISHYCIELLSGRKNEHFYMLCLNSRNELIDRIHISEGTPNEVYVPVRTIVEKAVECSAKKVVLTHNHPGGTLNASLQDLEITGKAKVALENVGIELYDHVLVARDKAFSITVERIN